MNAIEVQNLRRVFRTTLGVFKRSTKEVVAVDDVSFAVASGELFGLLGPNGAGKTTSVKMLTTLLIPTEGSAHILGHDVVKEAEAIRPRIGFIFGGERGLYWRLSAIDNLRYFATLYQLDPEVTKKRIPYLLDLVGLSDRGREKVEGYSRGMKQRLHIARTLLHDPELLFLDEPSIGLDPVAAREMRQIVRNLQSEKKTILLTTHYMFEADALCQRIAVIDHGRIIALDTPNGLEEARAGFVGDRGRSVRRAAAYVRSGARHAARRCGVGGEPRSETGVDRAVAAWLGSCARSDGGAQWAAGGPCRGA